MPLTLTPAGSERLTVNEGENALRHREKQEAYDRKKKRRRIRKQVGKLPYYEEEAVKYVSSPVIQERLRADGKGLQP